MFAAITRRRRIGEDRGRSAMALPPRAPTATSESEAKLSSSSVAARDLMVASGGSTSGTSSTSYYTSSRGSVLSSGLVAQLQFIDDEEKAKRLERAEHLAKKFCHCDGDVGVMERWLSEMGVGWVLDLADDPSAGMTSLLRAQPQRDNLTERWIRALTEITESIHFMSLLEGRFAVQFVRFLEATVQKMLPFFDALLAAADLDTDPVTAGVSNGEQVSSEKLQALLSVRDAVSRASEGIRLCFYWESSGEMEAQRSNLLSLLSEKDHRLDEAIWNTMEEVRTSILSDDNGDDNNEWSIIQTPEGSSSICNDTRSFMAYIKSLWNNYSRLDHTVCAAAELGSYVPNHDMISTSFHLSAEQVKTDPFTALTLEMVSSLEVKLARRSESFQDHSLKFLFLINNTHFIQQQLHPLCHMKFHTKVLTPKIEDYIEKYLQASWAPVMSFLKNDTPRCFRSNSTLPKFDSEFQKTYTAQMLWKVPDTELRTRLRKAIIEQVVPSFRGYLEGSNITSPGVTPQELERMLLALFEG